MERRSLRLLVGITLFLLTACGGSQTPASTYNTTYDDEGPSGVTVNTTPDPQDETDSSPSTDPDETTPPENENGEENQQPPPDSETPGETPTEEPPTEDPAEEETESPNDPPESGTPLSLAPSCTFGDNSSCETGQICASIFAAAGTTEIDISDSACYATCTGTGTACTTTTGLAGTCNAFSSGFLCVAEGNTLGPCGNQMNSACGSTAPICLTQPGASVGVCARLCNPEDITTCRALSGNGCGCLDGQACSVSPMGVNEPGGGIDGVCAPPSTAGDACGLDTATYLTNVCTSGQNCITTMTGGNQGTCQDP